MLNLSYLLHRDTEEACEVPFALEVQAEYYPEERETSFGYFGADPGVPAEVELVRVTCDGVPFELTPEEAREVEAAFFELVSDPY